MFDPLSHKMHYLQEEQKTSDGKTVSICMQIRWFGELLTFEVFLFASMVNIVFYIWGRCVCAHVSVNSLDTFGDNSKMKNWNKSAFKKKKHTKCLPLSLLYKNRNFRAFSQNYQYKALEELSHHPPVSNF